MAVKTNKRTEKTGENDKSTFTIPGVDIFEALFADDIGGPGEPAVWTRSGTDHRLDLGERDLGLDHGLSAIGMTRDQYNAVKAVESNVVQGAVGVLANLAAAHAPELQDGETAIVTVRQPGFTDGITVGVRRDGNEADAFYIEDHRNDHAAAIGGILDTRFDNLFPND